MKQLFLIAPYSVDKEYSTKKVILTSLKCDSNLIITAAEDVSVNGFFNLEKTLYAIQISDFILADLSFERPSCYYEIGYAQALNKDFFLIAKTGTNIHQVIGQVHFYENLDAYEKIIIELFLSFKNK